MSKLSDLINAEDSFLVKLRCENTFDETKYLEIKNQILIEMPKWRAQGFILNCDVEVLISLIDQLAGEAASLARKQQSGLRMLVWK